MRVRKVAARWVVALLMVVALFTNAWAVDVWYTSAQSTLKWDPVTTTTDGSLIPAGQVVMYDVWYKADGDARNFTKLTSAPITGTQYIVSFSVRGKYNLGAQASVYDSGGVLVNSSEIAWSDNEAACINGKSFGIDLTIAAPAPITNPMIIP